MTKKRTLEVGTVFNRLTVINGDAGMNQHNKLIVICKCECGEVVNVLATQIKYGHTKSCGCLQKEKASRVNFSHGLTDTLTHRIWKGIKTRCLNSNRREYQYYGARGITICDSWKNSFETFLQDMGECPPGMSIDRINNDLGYCPENCKWATIKEQNNNSRNVRWIEYLGKTKTLTQWALDYNINIRTLRARLEKGWDIEKALTTPVKGK